jgi:hypothetical protein
LYCAAASLALAACGNDLGSDPGSGLGSGVSSSTGLPCDVQAILTDHCDGCHGATLAGGAPIHLQTYADLTATSSAGVTAAQRCLDRMKNAAAQMPPPPAASLTATEVSAFQAWVAAGAPNGECTTGGSGGGFGGPTVCSSGQTWTGGNRESPLMHPGRACISCHSSGEGPRFQIAGTAYPTGHEPDDCYGATGAAVEVTDARGAVTSLALNAAGNFFSSAAIAFPIHVAVVANGARRAMAGSPPSGDCNTCHTPDGTNQAPGRIALP